VRASHEVLLEITLILPIVGNLQGILDQLLKPHLLNVHIFIICIIIIYHASEFQSTQFFMKTQ
jgi:hypothetical protein